MKKNLLYFSFFFLILNSCTKDKGVPDYGGYPDEVGKIIYSNCTNPGCHTNENKENVEGLSLQGWDAVFAGGEHNAAIVPFSSRFSSVFSFINTFPDLGISNHPTMPFENSPLSREDVLTIKNWIDAGAPDRNGFVKFSDNTSRRKYYVTNQGCDVVTVVDAETGLIMRYIDVGVSTGIESPHMIRVSPDGQYWYVIFSNLGTVIQKFRTSDDSYVGSINITQGNWNTFVISPDSKQAFILDFQNNGRVAQVDLDNLNLISVWQGSGLFVNPHGAAIGNLSDSVYIAAQSGNFIYKVSPADPSSPRLISLVTGQSPSTTSSINPHEIAFSPDFSEYFVTCQGTNEVRIFQSSNDSLLKTISVGILPSEISFSTTMNYAFITCQEDIGSSSLFKGSVAIIDYTTNSLIKILNDGFFQPHGLVVDDKAMMVYVANRNVTTGGPAPHHTSVCGGKSGYINFIDLNSLEVINDKEIEIATDPYSVALRK